MDRVRWLARALYLRWDILGKISRCGRMNLFQTNRCSIWHE